MSNKIIRVGVIGCGVISQNHLYALSKLDNLEIAGVCDIIPERAEKASKEYGCPAFTDYHELFEKAKPDSVHICLPHYLHAPVSIEAMESGIDVLCEKPMHKDLSGAFAMKEAADRTGRKLGVIFQNRYNSGSILAKQTLRSGALGPILGINGTVMWHRDDAYYKNGAWRASYETSGGGVIINQAIHTLDLIRWLADSDVISVKATVAHHGSTSAEVEDTAEGVIRFSSGIDGLFYFSINNSCDEHVTVTVYCERGKIRITGAECEIICSDDKHIESKPAEETFYGAKSIYGSSHVRQIDEFYREGCESKVRKTVEEALKTQQLIDMIFKSAGQ